MITAMRKRKLVKQINYKNMSVKQFTELVNNSLHIKLSSHAKLIDNIHDRYPIVSKQEVSLIVKTFFDILRECLIAGEIISFNKTFSNMKLMIYKYQRNKKDYVSVKVKISTPIGIK